MSTNTPSNKAFYRAFGLAIAGLSIGILILALLVITSGPWVRQVAVQNLSGGDAASVNQALTVVFDRPIVGTDFASAIDIQPETNYTVSHRNQQLNITFNQNLLSNTEYVLTVKPVLEDDLGKQMEREYTYEFSTAEPSFTYLEHNPGSGAISKVIERVPLSQKSRILYGTREEIKSFARNANYLAVVLARDDNTDELRVVDLGTREERSLDLPHDVRIDNLTFSPTDNQFVFVTRAIPMDDASEEDEGYVDTLYQYDIEGEQLRSIDTLSDKRSRQLGAYSGERALYSGDGQALLYQKLDAEFYLTGATQTMDPIPLGKYRDSGGFDRTNTKLTFPSGSSAAIYDAQAGDLQEVSNINIGGRISTPTFLHNSDKLLYLKQPLDAKPGTLQLYTADLNGEAEEQVVDTQSQGSFVGEPVVSYDDRYVLIEVTSGAQASDGYAGGQQPKDPQLVLYDRLDGKVIDSDTRGSHPVWNR